MQTAGEKTLSGENAFKLYDTYGFPLDLTQEILEEKGFSIDEDGFKKAMEIQKKKAHDAHKATNYMGADATVYDEIDPSITTEFTGYDSLTASSKITVLTTETELVEALSDGEVGHDHRGEDAVLCDDGVVSREIRARSAPPPVSFRWKRPSSCVVVRSAISAR